jgi:flagellum-specific peptidoglycan hydrolase FlgJ
MKPAELAKLGKTDKKAFFAALLPAALESERKYGVPAEVTLAQAALESGWAKSPIGGYNIFGIKGSGPAGSVKLGTVEYGNQATKARFAKYHNFYEAIGEHGKVYNNGSYKKGMAQYAKDKNPQKFIDNIAKIYATTPGYGATLKSMISKYKLQDMANASRQAPKRPTE